MAIMKNKELSHVVSMEFYPVGDSAVTIVMGDRIDPILHNQIVAMKEQITSLRIPGVEEVIPSYCSLLVRYNPMEIRYYALVRRLKKVSLSDSKTKAYHNKTITIPVCYDLDYGPDIKEVAAYHNLTIEEVIARHSNREYRIYMLGFLPGFPYLGGLDEMLVTPRLNTPRQRIPAGSVGIGGEQTGIYPLSSPGGWRIIGRTPLVLFDPTRKHPFLYEAGDAIQFQPITKQEYEQIMKE